MFHVDHFTQDGISFYCPFKQYEWYVQLAIPGIALIKVTFERVKSLRPWATLLSDENSDGTEQKSRIRKAITRLKKK